MPYSRRAFLRGPACVFGGISLASSIETFGGVGAYASASSNDCRALVCVFLGGGNDGNDMVVPLDEEFEFFNKIRNAPGAGRILQRESFLPITPKSNRPFGLHPGLKELQELFGQGQLAVACNIGPLIEPMTRKIYRSGAGKRPAELFSHSRYSSQQNTVVKGIEQTESSVQGNSFAAGIKVPAGFQTIVTPTNAKTLVNRWSKTSHVTDADTKKRQTKFAQIPDTVLGSQLQEVAGSIARQKELGIRQQIFFCYLSGFDTHRDQRELQGSLLTQLSRALRGFYDVTVELGVAHQVTTFTLSDFGRTFDPSDYGTGTDHGWGNHHLIVGGSVRGGDLYGRFPELALGGPDDACIRGRWIPSTCVEQYTATLAGWYGLSASNLSAVFPLVNRFPTADLGFML